MAPIEQTAPRIVGEAVDGDIQLVVVGLGEIDGFDAQDRPPFVVGFVGENETSSRVALPIRRSGGFAGGARHAGAAGEAAHADAPGPGVGAGCRIAVAKLLAELYPEASEDVFPS